MTNRRAVGEGLEASAKVITSAALIMVVFGTFALTDRILPRADFESQPDVA